MLIKRRNIGMGIVLFLFFFGFIAVQAQVNPFKIVNDEDLEKAAAKRFSKAVSFYKNGEYWKSSRELIELVDEYSEFSEIAQAVYILANCLDELNMQEGAFKLYETVLTNYISSSYVPDALLGLQRIEYERDNFSASLDYYETLLRGNPSAEIIDLSNYYAGMAYYKQSNYPMAVEALLKASSKSPYYDYILYTLAISMLRMQDVNPAIDVFQQLFELPITNDERRHVVDEAHLTLGYLYYELDYYDRAIEQFKLVAPNSAKHPNALLAMGWAASQKKDWQQAIAPLTELYTHYKVNDITQEGLFLLGRSYLKLNRYDEAINIYDHLIAIFPEEDEVVTSIETINENIELERQRIEKRQMELLVLEGNLVDDLQKTEDMKRRNLSQDQTVLLRDIQRERQELAEHLAQLDKLARATALREERRNWRAYAEYGKSRATFLKRQRDRYQNKQQSE